MEARRSPKAFDSPVEGYKGSSLPLAIEGADGVLALLLTVVRLDADLVV